MDVSRAIDTLRLGGIAFLEGAARTREEALEVAARFGTVLDAETVNQALPDDPERTSDPDSPQAVTDPAAVRSVGALDLHTDCSQQDVPCTLTSLYCEHSDPSGGGATTWLHVDDLLNSLDATEEGRLAKEVLASVAVPFAQPNGATSRLKWFRALARSPAGTTIRFAGSYIRLGAIAAAEVGRPIPSEAMTALHVLQRTIRELEPPGRALTPGDFVVIDNHRVLHGRTAIVDTMVRSLWRMKLNSHAARS